MGVGHVAKIRDSINVYNIVLRKWPWFSWEQNIKTNLTEMGSNMMNYL